MAQTSITVPITKFYEYLQNGTTYKQYYRDLSQPYLISQYPNNGDKIYMCLGLPDLKATLGRHILYGIGVTFRIVAPYPSGNSYFFEGLWLATKLPTENPGSQYIPAPTTADAGKQLIKYDTHPIAEPGSDTLLSFSSTTGESDKSRVTANALVNRTMLLSCGISNPKIKIYTTLLNGTAPTLTIYYDSTEVIPRLISSVSGVTSGYWNPRIAHTIGWQLTRNPTNVYYAVDSEIKPVHTTMYWREYQAADPDVWTSVSLPDNASSADIPANTFPTGTSIFWYLSVQDEDNITSESNKFFVTTKDSTSTATPTAPVNSIEIGNKPIIFNWTVANPSGALPTRVIVEWATAADAAQWTTLVDEPSAIYSYEATANTFPGGNIYWRVTSYNCDDEAGPTSDVVTFSCIAPPSPPENVIADSAPFVTISWQADVQTAYEISIDGKIVERKFGVGVYSYKLKEPLADGTHTVSVRVQGGFGYWSTATTAETVTENQGKGRIEVTGQFKIDGNLDWNWIGGENNPVFRVYRDGILIARTRNNYFQDRFVLGTHRYEILAELEGGNYVRSSEITGTMKSCVTMIAPAVGGDWIELGLSENSNSTQVFAWNKSVTLRHYAGAAYPVAELSPYEDRIASYDCAFSTVAEAKVFESLRGQIVILKSRGGEVTIGPLATVNKTTGDFYIMYQFSVNQIHWEDFVDDTDS